MAKPRNIPTGEQLRDRGVALVLGHNPTWYQQVMFEMARVWRVQTLNGNTQTFTGEDIKRYIRDRKGWIPKHHNAYSSITLRLLQYELIERVAQRSHTVDSSGHKRELTRYHWKP